MLATLPGMNAWGRAREALLLGTITVVSGGGGCSFAFVDAAPSNAAALPYFDCTSGRLAPNADAAMAGLFALGVIGATTDSPSTSDTDGAFVAGAVALGMLSSAVYGWRTTARCREAKAELAARARWPVAPAVGDPWTGDGSELLSAPSPAPGVSSP